MTKQQKGKRYSVGGLITISVYTEVVAASPEEARELASQRGIMSLCYQCSNSEPECKWVTSGELDCDTPSPYDGAAEFDVVEL